MITHKTGTHLALSSGDYSSHHINGIFQLLQDIDLADCAKRYYEEAPRELWDEEESTASVEGLGAWLVAHHLVEEIMYDEIKCGGFDFELPLVTAAAQERGRQLQRQQVTRDGASAFPKTVEGGSALGRQFGYTENCPLVPPALADATFDLQQLELKWFDPKVWRHPCSAELVDEYVQHPLNTPIIVDPNKHVPIDGWHRLQASKRLGQPSIPAYVPRELFLPLDVPLTPTF